MANKSDHEMMKPVTHEVPIHFSDYTAPSNSATVVSVECCRTGTPAIVCLLFFENRKSHGKL